LLFQPLLYQAATAGLSPAEIAAPIRSIVGRTERVTVMLGEVFGVDTAQRLVQFKDTSAICPMTCWWSRRERATLTSDMMNGLGWHPASERE
jgi:NADH dehydrogenase FAD-containing subunit